MPAKWMEFQLDTLRTAARRYPIISISRKPMKLGTNLLDNGPRGYWNIYMQLLRAAQLARTKYVAVAEDDVLYTREHFRDFRPPEDATSFDRSRWSLFTWDPLPIFCLRQRVSNCSTIAPRDLYVEALEERHRRWPQGPPRHKNIGEVGREKIDRGLDVTVRKAVEWYCRNPIVHLNHQQGTDMGMYPLDSQGRRLKKKHGQIKAIEIPYWGKAETLVRIYQEACCGSSS
jgi:hypothetical protein